MYQVLDALLIRASTHPTAFDLPAWPDPVGGLQAEVVSDWLTAVWSRGQVAEGITAASPTLAGQVERVRAGLCRDPRQLRRTVASVSRYLLRMTGRSTPFALFAGVAPAGLGAQPTVRWGRRHQPIIRADGAWLAAVTTLLEGCPALLRRLPVVLNDLADIREDRVLVPCQRPPTHQDPRGGELNLVDVSVRRTAAVAALITYARNPIVVADLIDKLRTDFPNGAASTAETAITQLVQTRVLLTALQPPMTVTDGLGHLLTQLAFVDAQAIPEVADTVQALRAVADTMRHHNAGASADGGVTRPSALVEQMNPVRAGSGRPVAVDLRLDATVTLPDTLIRHARDAAAVLTRLTPYPRGMPSWQDYHAAFLERYGVGAVVPLADVVDPAIGLGLPATYRGSDRSVAGPPVSERDRGLLRLAQQATMGGGDEIMLDERIVADLAGPDARVQVPPHVELFVQIHAGSAAALRQDRYTLVVSGAARAVGSTTGRFLHLLDPVERTRFRDAYSAVATVRAAAEPAQLSFPPVLASSDHLACAPPMLPMLLSAGEFVDGDEPIRVDDLAVGGDTDGLFLVSRRHRRLIEPTVLNAVEFRHFSHPMARFLCELPRARAAVYMPFSWGVAEALPFLPRLRYGRTVLSPARWNLTARDLPPLAAPWSQWKDALAGWRQRLRLPDRVYLVEADNLLPLDLRENLHQDLLRTHLDRHGHARLDEAPPRHAYRWLDGHAHEITIPLTSTAPPIKAPHMAPIRTVGRNDGHLPGTAWLYAKLYTAAGRTVEILRRTPELLAGWNEAIDWWYLPYRDPEPHLRLRIRLPHPGAYGPSTARVAAWAARLRHHRLVGRLQLDTYYPETGRYGHGPAMTAAEQVFAADSAATLAELQAAGTALPLDALAAASLVDITAAFTGDTATGMRWLTTYLPNEPMPAPRAVHTTAVRVADPTDDWAALRTADHTSTVLGLWQQRRAAIADYRDQLAPQRDPLSVLPSLLHLHSIRLHGIDPDRERLGRRLARASALRWSALQPAEPR
ncbi:lantibiotic dehydratase [Micromonospora sp. CA-263727]|uniref:lantibiotic dehydratase n=1 Tax=Micromonospora sp. CA-263727 TaxID=3239967 RepID=UPI003D8F78CF